MRVVVKGKEGRVRRTHILTKTIDYIYANKNKIVNKEDIANLMNTYFCEIGANLSKNMKQPILIIFITYIRLLYTEVNKECVDKSKILHACYGTSIIIAKYFKKCL